MQPQNLFQISQQWCSQQDKTMSHNPNHQLPQNLGFPPIKLIEDGLIQLFKLSTINLENNHYKYFLYPNDYKINNQFFISKHYIGTYLSHIFKFKLDVYSKFLHKFMNNKFLFIFLLSLICCKESEEAITTIEKNNKIRFLFMPISMFKGNEKIVFIELLGKLNIDQFLKITPITENEKVAYINILYKHLNNDKVNPKKPTTPNLYINTKMMLQKIIEIISKEPNLLEFNNNRLLQLNNCKHLNVKFVTSLIEKLFANGIFTPSVFILFVYKIGKVKFGLVEFKEFDLIYNTPTLEGMNLILNVMLYCFEYDKPVLNINDHIINTNKSLKRCCTEELTKIYTGIVIMYYLKTGNDAYKQIWELIIGYSTQTKKSPHDLILLTITKTQNIEFIKELLNLHKRFVNNPTLLLEIHSLLICICQTNTYKQYLVDQSVWSIENCNGILHHLKKKVLYFGLKIKGVTITKEQFIEKFKNNIDTKLPFNFERYYIQLVNALENRQI